MSLVDVLLLTTSLLVVTLLVGSPVRALRVERVAHEDKKADPPSPLPAGVRVDFVRVHKHFLTPAASVLAAEVHLAFDSPVFVLDEKGNHRSWSDASANDTQVLDGLVSIDCGDDRDVDVAGLLPLSTDDARPWALRRWFAPVPSNEVAVLVAVPHLQCGDVHGRAHVLWDRSAPDSAASSCSVPRSCRVRVRGQGRLGGFHSGPLREDAVFDLGEKLSLPAEREPHTVHNFHLFVEHPTHRPAPTGDAMRRREEQNDNDATQATMIGAQTLDEYFDEAFAFLETAEGPVPDHGYQLIGEMNDNDDDEGKKEPEKKKETQNAEKKKKNEPPSRPQQQQQQEQEQQFMGEMRFQDGDGDKDQEKDVVGDMRVDATPAEEKIIESPTRRDDDGGHFDISPDGPVRTQPVGENGGHCDWSPDGGKCAAKPGPPVKPVEPPPPPPPLLHVQRERAFKEKLAKRGKELKHKAHGSWEKTAKEAGFKAAKRTAPAAAKEAAVKKAKEAAVKTAKVVGEREGRKVGAEKGAKAAKEKVVKAKQQTQKLGGTIEKLVDEQLGRKVGKKVGKKEGTKAGKKAGKKAGEKAGRKAGQGAGPNAGRDAGRSAGAAAGSVAAVDWAHANGRGKDAIQAKFEGAAADGGEGAKTGKQIGEQTGADAGAEAGAGAGANAGAAAGAKGGAEAGGDAGAAVMPPGPAAAAEMLPAAGNIDPGGIEWCDMMLPFANPFCSLPLIPMLMFNIVCKCVSSAQVKPVFDRFEEKVNKGKDFALMITELLMKKMPIPPSFLEVDSTASPGMEELASIRSVVDEYHKSYCNAFLDKPTLEKQRRWASREPGSGLNHHDKIQDMLEKMTAQTRWTMKRSSNSKG